MNTAKPLTPKEVSINMESRIPDEVIAAVNNLLTKEFDGTVAILRQNDIIVEIIRLMPSSGFGEDFIASGTNEKKRACIFENGWLNFENLFMKEGCKNLIGYTKEEGEIEKFSTRWRKIKTGDLFYQNSNGYNKCFRFSSV